MLSLKVVLLRPDPIMKRVWLIIVSLFSGHVADTFNRKHIIILFTSLLVVCTSALLYFSLDTSTVIKEYGVTPMFLVIGGIGIIRGFLAAAFPAFMAQLVPRELYTSTSTWNSTAWHIASVIGPAMAGFICAVSFIAAYEVDIIFIIIAVLSFLFIGSKPLPKKEKKESLKESLSAGIKFVFGHQLILGALSLDLFAVLFGGAVAMLPAYADKILHVGSVELGFLRAVPAFHAELTGHGAFRVHRGANAAAGHDDIHVLFHDAHDQPLRLRVPHREHAAGHPGGYLPVPPAVLLHHHQGTLSQRGGLCGAMEGDGSARRNRRGCHCGERASLQEEAGIDIDSCSSSPTTSIIFSEALEMEGQTR